MPPSTTNGRVTLAVIDEQLKTTHKLVEQMASEFKDHCRLEAQDRVDMLLRVDRLEQSQANRSKHYFIIYPAIMASLVAWLVSWWNHLFTVGTIAK